MARTGENIYKRKDGRWEARYIFEYDGNGKAKYRYLYSKTYAEVKAKLLKAQSDKLHNEPQKCKSDLLYSYWLDEWLTKKRMTVKESTYIRYKNTIENHIRPELGKYPISRISTPLMEQFIAKKFKSGRLDRHGGLSSKSMADLLVIVKETFKYAQLSGEIIVCSFDRMTFKRIPREMRVLSLREEQLLLSVLLDDPDRYKLGVFICLYTGIRIGELCALQWKDISFEDKTLKIEKTLQRLQFDNEYAIPRTHLIITEPKSHSAIRTIPLPDFILELLEPFYSSENTPVLSNQCDTFVEPRTMQNRFKSYLRKAGIEDANFHALRHTFATRCVESGFDVKTLSEILGHSSVKLTLDKYVHSSMQLKRTNMEKLQMAILPKH